MIEVLRGSGNPIALRLCSIACGWANHLRPNLRKGPFSPDEERLILRLHGLIGNKWARISSQVRTP